MPPAGLTVHMGHDLGLHALAKHKSEGGGEAALRENVWGVCCTLDLLLSLQLGRPPAIIPPSTRSSLADVSTLSTPSSLFGHTVSQSYHLSH